MIGTTDTDRSGQTFTRVAVKLGSGKVHYARKYDGWGVSPQCGGNRASERYYVTTADVDCKRCLKLLAAEEAAELAHQDRVDASMQPATGEGDYLAPAKPEAQQPDAEPVKARQVSVDMQSETQGVALVHGADGFQGLIGADGDGGFYAEDPYAETMWHRDGFGSVTAAADGLARSDGFAGTVRITVTREYSTAVSVTSTTEAPAVDPSRVAGDAEEDVLAAALSSAGIVFTPEQLSAAATALTAQQPEPPAVTEVRIVMDSDSVGIIHADGTEVAVALLRGRWTTLGFGVSSSSLKGAAVGVARHLGVTGPVTTTVARPLD
jgi:hypothetical protein